MQLTVTFPDGAVVAHVDVRVDCPFAEQPGEPPGFVLGSFVPGPAFQSIREKLDVFNQVFSTGDLVRASELHDAMDKLGLLATDSQGRVYSVSLVYFQPGGILFAALDSADS